MLLTAMIFGSGADAQTRIQQRCLKLGDVNLFPSHDTRPSNSDMVRIINSYAPEIVFVEFHDRDDAIRTEEYLRVSCPKVALIGFASDWQHEMMIHVPGRYLRVVSPNVGVQELKEIVQGALTTGRAS